MNLNNLKPGSLIKVIDHPLVVRSFHSFEDIKNNFNNSKAIMAGHYLCLDLVSTEYDTARFKSKFVKLMNDKEVFWTYLSSSVQLFFIIIT